MSEPTYSPGLEGIVAGETAVSSLTTGLNYRGYPIDELGQHAVYEEVAYLLLHGELPAADELLAFRKRLADAARVPEEIIRTLRQIPLDAPMMDVMRSGCSLLAHWEREVNDNAHEANVRKAERLVAQLPVLLAARARMVQGQEPVAADPRRTWSENFLWMYFRREPDPRWVKAFDVSMILYAEHEFNASTFSARVVASTLADLHSAVTAAIGALKGPLHGGANERVLEVLQQVGAPENAESWIRDALAKKVRIMGFGHRVYKERDPRAEFLKDWCRTLAAETGHAAMEQTAEVIEGVVHAEKKLPPNVDWPSARLYHYMQLPVSIYTPLFVMARVAGWCAHIIEQLDHNRLIRPSARYVGVAARSWLPLAGR